MLLKTGSRGHEVTRVQEALGLKADGVYGAGTSEAVKAFQKENMLTADGMVGNTTWATIMEAAATTDNTEKSYSPYDNLLVHKYFLPKGEYKEGPIQKEYLFLHHTAGWDNPYATVDMWAKDNRGAVATEFVLGGPSADGKRDRYDGELVQCIPEGSYGWHLGKNGSQHMHTHSVAIEVCNFGQIKNGKTYVNSPVAQTQTATLETPFRGFSHYHAYSDKQLETLKTFILWIAERDSIDVRAGLVDEIKKNGAKAFEYNEDAYYGKIKGMWTHTNTRPDKFDLSPQPALLDMLLSL